jgi:hypothetical protein
VTYQGQLYEDPVGILTSIRRKSALPVGTCGACLSKVSYKVDIDHYHDMKSDIAANGGSWPADSGLSAHWQQRLGAGSTKTAGNWHALKKLSLENGDGSGLLNEGLAWASFRSLNGLPSALPSDFVVPSYLVNLANYITLKFVAMEEVTTAVDNGDGTTTNSTEIVESELLSGVYLSVEDVDKSFLERRKMWPEK